jgi:hypothetical protein
MAERYGAETSVPTGMRGWSADSAAPRRVDMVVTGTERR